MILIDVHTYLDFSMICDVLPFSCDSEFLIKVKKVKLAHLI